MMETKIRPQKMTRADFRKSAVALQHEGEAAVWKVFLGHEVLGGILAESAAQAVDAMHLQLVSEAMMNHATTRGARDVTGLPSSAALVDYPKLVVRYPRTVWLILEWERAARDLALSKERQAIAGLMKLVEQMLNGKATKKELEAQAAGAMKPAQAILDSAEAISVRESSLEALVREILDNFDAGAITGGAELFELARSLVESSGVPTFTTWMAGVESCVAGDELDAKAYRPLYDKGLSPSEAVLVEPIGSGVFHH